MKKKLTILIIISLILNFSFVKAEVSQTTIDYLLAQAQNQWITMGLSAAGQTDLDLSYLDDFSGSSANEYSKTILALVAADQDPYDYNGTDFVAGLESYHQNNQIGATNMISDDFWGIIALRSAGVEVNDIIIQDSKNFVLDNQEADGGWGYAPGAGSDTNDTAAAIMALLDAGLTVDSTEIQAAITYLQSMQNPDGGFPFMVDGESDSGSDSWVIASLNKAGIDPNSWLQEENTPITHLESLSLDDGSFRWLADDSEGNPLMTAYAAVALADSYYPVAYFEPPPVNTSLHHLRIEGANGTYCDDPIESITALDIIENGSEICGYTYVIEETGFGPYLTTINSEAAEGMSGWLYRVNWLSPEVGANDYILEENDQVLWYFGEWGIQPLRLSLSASQIDPEEEVIVSVEYYNETDWQVANEATVYVDEQTYQTDVSGQVTLTLEEVGSYEIYAEKENFIRSNREDLMISSEVSQTIDMIVDIHNPGGGGENLSFIVDTSNLDFGSLEPGESANSVVAVTNNGDMSLHLEAVVSGDSLFEDNTYLDDTLWENYSDNYNVNQSKNVDVRLDVPGNFSGSGQRQGSLIFWASSL